MCSANIYISTFDFEIIYDIKQITYKEPLNYYELVILSSFYDDKKVV